MKNKSSWSENLAQDPLKAIQDFHKAIMADFVTPKIYVLHPRTAKILEDYLEKKGKRNDYNNFNCVGGTWCWS
jgi:hypothetical protein